MSAGLREPQAAPSRASGAAFDFVQEPDALLFFRLSNSVPSAVGIRADGVAVKKQYRLNFIKDEVLSPAYLRYSLFQ